MDMRTDLTAVPHASLSEKPKGPGRKLVIGLQTLKEHENERRRQGDDGSRKSTELKRSQPSKMSRRCISRVLHNKE